MYGTNKHTEHSHGHKQCKQPHLAPQNKNGSTLFIIGTAATRHSVVPHNEPGKKNGQKYIAKLVTRCPDLAKCDTFLEATLTCKGRL